MMLNTFSRMMQEISTDAARLWVLRWMVRIERQRRQAMMARSGRRIPDGDVG